MTITERFRIAYVPADGEFLVSDTAGRFCHGMPMVCADDAAVIRHILNVIRDERIHGQPGSA